VPARGAPFWFKISVASSITQFVSCGNAQPEDRPTIMQIALVRPRPPVQVATTRSVRGCAAVALRSCLLVVRRYRHSIDAPSTGDQSPTVSGMSSITNEDLNPYLTSGSRENASSTAMMLSLFSRKTRMAVIRQPAGHNRNKTHCVRK
jgi:hypothetical protein